ncbi:MAG TPA: hypothetical protein VE093_44135 [Polyangiaceae bacterium]|nr:hypothetical protein [Polyangiaceae bacterium]
MKYLMKALFSALVLGIVACGGPSDSDKLVDLSDDEITDLCSEFDAESKDCGGGLTVSREPTQCSAPLKNVPTSCTATVGDLRSCNEADLCALDQNAGCKAVFACASSSGGS